MKNWCGNSFEYRGYNIKNNIKDGYLEVYDKNNNYAFRVDSFGKGYVSEVKHQIDRLIKRYGS